MQFNTKAYISDICDILQIKTPRISNNGTRFGKMPTFPSLADRVRHAIDMRIDYLIDCGY